MLLAALLVLAQASAPPTNVASRFQCTAPTVDAERIFEGIYVDDFEGQRFFEGAGTLADLDFRDPKNVWLEVPVADLMRLGVTQRVYEHAYRVRLEGIKHAGREGPPMACGYGHFGGSDAEIRLTELLSAEPLGAVR